MTERAAKKLRKFHFPIKREHPLRGAPTGPEGPASAGRRAVRRNRTILFISVLVLGLVIGAAFFASSEVERMLEEDTERHLASAGASIRRSLERDYGRMKRLRRQRPEELWRSSLRGLFPTTLSGVSLGEELGMPDLKGIVMRPPGEGAEAYAVGEPAAPWPAVAQEGLRFERIGGDRWVTFALPGSAARADRFQFSLRFDRAEEDARRKRMIDFQTFGVVCVALVVHLLAALTLALNRNTFRLAIAEGEKTTRLAAMSDVAGAIAHEIRNPLNAIGLKLQLIERLGVDEVVQGETRRINEQLRRLSKVVDNFVRFARAPALQRASCDVAEVVRDARDRVLSAEAGPPEAIPLVTKGEVVLSADPVKLAEALEALVRDAWLATRADAERGGDADSAADPAVRISVVGTRRLVQILLEDRRTLARDTDPARLFDPHTEAGAGFGLGLALARTLVLAHEGTIRADHRPEGGVLFAITLPRSLD